MNDIAANVKQYILAEFLPGEDPARLTDDLPLVSGRILDSLATLKLVSFLEDTYGIRFEAHEVSIDNLDTINAIAHFVEQKRG